MKFNTAEISLMIQVLETNKIETTIILDLDFQENYMMLSDL